MRKKKHSEFINECLLIHGDIYDYSLIDYKNNKTKIKINCKEHGIFEQFPQDHLKGHGCPYCSGNKNYTKDEFIKRSIEIYGDKHDYSIVNYTNNKSIIEIICKEHGVFKVRPDIYLQKRGGCKKCSNVVFDTSSFIEKSNLIHKNLYIYDLSDYKGNEIKLKIYCKKHGYFEQTPHSHLSGSGCPNCMKNKKITNDDFIRRSIETHNDLYEYDKTEYKNCSTDVIIKCKKHGYFKQNPYTHLQGSGCRLCNNSKGEENISKCLKKFKIFFEREKKFKNCRNILELPFDFYLPEHKICIEFDGEQHFKEKIGRFDFEKIKINDEIKNNYCSENNIDLIRIPYYDISKIEKIIIEKIIN